MHRGEDYGRMTSEIYQAWTLSLDRDPQSRQTWWQPELSAFIFPKYRSVYLGGYNDA
jgi:hypothetical protein